MRRLFPILLLIPLLGLAAEPLPDLVTTPVRSGAKNPNDSAIVIGIEDYFAVQDVPYAARDAEAFQGFLVYTRGVPQARVRSLVSVTGSNRASREKILEAVTQAGQETPAGGTVWIFFSGHGVADPSDPQERLILGQDAMGDEGSFMARGVSLDEMRSLAGAGGGEVVLILDACYGGAGRSGDALLPGKHFVVPQYQLGGVSTGIEWDAAGPNQLSGPLDAASQGAFSYFSTGALRGWADGELDGSRDNQVTAGEAQAYVERMLKVAGIRSQVPVLGGSIGKVLSKGKLEVGPTDEQVSQAMGAAPTANTSSSLSTGSNDDMAALVAAASRAREAEAKLLKAKEAEFAQASATMQARAKQEWAVVAPLVVVKDAASKKVVDAYVAKYGSATATVAGESRTVAIPEVATARAWLESYPRSTAAGVAVSSQSPEGTSAQSLVKIIGLMEEFPFTVDAKIGEFRTDPTDPRVGNMSLSVEIVRNQELASKMRSAVKSLNGTQEPCYGTDHMFPKLPTHIHYLIPSNKVDFDAFMATMKQIEMPEITDIYQPGQRITSSPTPWRRNGFNTFVELVDSEGEAVRRILMMSASYNGTYLPQLWAMPWLSKAPNDTMYSYDACVVLAPNQSSAFDIRLSQQEASRIVAARGRMTR